MYFLSWIIKELNTHHIKFYFNIINIIETEIEYNYINNNDEILLL